MPFFQKMLHNQSYWIYSVATYRWQKKTRVLVFYDGEKHFKNSKLYVKYGNTWVCDTNAWWKDIHTDLHRNEHLRIVCLHRSRMAIVKQKGQHQIYAMVQGPSLNIWSNNKSFSITASWLRSNGPSWSVESNENLSILENVKRPLL